MRILMIVAALCLTFPTHAQDERNGKMKAYKVTFLTSKLSLTPEEASKFWPLYNEFSTKQKEIRRRGIGKYRDRRPSDYSNLTEKEANQQLAQIEENEEEAYQLRRRYNAALRNVLPAVKILKLRKAEEDFNRKLLKEYREKGKRD